MKKKLIWLSIFLPGLLYLAKWLFEGTPIEGGAWSGGLTLTKIVNEFCAPVLILVGATAYGIALANVFRVHIMTLMNRKKGWQYSLIVFVSFVTVFAICVIYGWFSKERPEGAFDAVEFYRTYIYTPLLVTVLAILGFYITYAAYRAFKIKSLEGIVMMSVALIVMIGYDPLGNYLTRYLGNTRFFYLQLPELARFLREDMNGTVFRALQIGVYIASLAVSWRIWLGIEDHLSEGEEAK